MVTLGLTFLHQERQKAGGIAFPPEESCFYDVALLEHDTLRGLAMELLRTFPGATEVAARFLTKTACGPIEAGADS